MYSSNLKKIRKHLRYSIEKFADIVGIPPRTIGSYERNERTCSLELLSQLCKKLNVNANWFVSGIGDMFLTQNVDTLLLKDIPGDFQPDIIGRKLVDIQIANDLSPYKMASLLGMSETHYSNIVVGKDYISTEEISAILNKFQVSPGWLFNLGSSAAAATKKTQTESLGLTSDELLKLKKLLQNS